MSDQATAAVAEAPSIESRLAAALGAESQPEPAEPEPVQAAVPEAQAPAESDQADSSELTADDLPDETPPQSALDALEIEWNGQKKTLGRDELRDYAQKGFDYTQKTQQLSEERTRLQMMAQAVQQTAQLQQALVDDIGEVKAIQRELGRFPQSPDAWLKVSQDDPLGAFQARTQYDALVQQLQAKAAQIQHKQGQLQQSQGAITTEQLRAEFAKVQERIPAWRDQETFKKDASGIRTFLLSEGYQQAEVDNLADARALGIAFKAWKYDQLLRQKSERVKEVRQAPPVVKPGSANTGNGADRNKTQELRQRLRKSGDVKDAAAVLLQMQRK